MVLLLVGGTPREKFKRPFEKTIAGFYA